MNDTDVIKALKFSDCLPHDIAERRLQVRMKDSVGLRAVMTEPVRFVTALS